ncbi:hypothetical protein NBM05_14505 [Rothia sp. AR01]|uniref:Uncharacterized protein n=1 Tax=Rothia santali TaxID=2949643 RepID=A0A9X2HCN1_9MICC|nr:hypothetical protein [Rothia santali]MCP3427184.1 hypothetical protein [Rothia santali]
MADEATARRARAIVEGRVAEVVIRPYDAPPRYEAVLEVAWSRRAVPRGGDRPVRGSSPEADVPEWQERERPVAAGARVRLVWHGQRIVSGVGAGTTLRCSGLLTRSGADAVIYNPRYEIVSRNRQY